MNRLPEDKRLQFVPQDQRPPFTPQLALRVAIIGSFALAMFAIIFFRLWFLQVLSGEQYLAQASVNRVRNLDVPAPRGQIFDRNGNLLVDSKPAIAVQISVPDLPKAPGQRNALYRRLARVIPGISTKRKRCRVVGAGVIRTWEIPCDVAQQQALLPYANVTISTDVPSQVLYYISERPELFPGIEIQQVWLRTYPLNQLAAQLFGTVGPITATEVHSPRYRGVSQNAIVGQSGLEWYYDRYLRGTDGADQVEVDSLGRFRGDLTQHKPTAGHALKLSLDINLQRAGQQALQDAINNNPPATAGAFVAMNPQNGQIYAMGSLPTFDPNIFTKPVSESVYQQLNNAASDYPLINRAMQSAYPTGSTFKGITATAALESGAWSLGDTYDDTGVYSNGPTDQRHNAGHASYGVLDLVSAIKVSSDDFFYNLGRLMNAIGPHLSGGALQQWARRFGIGRPTGIDVGGESSGILPSPLWRAGRDKLEIECERGVGPFKGHGRHSSCGIADGRPWSVGDNENLAVGQGDLEATPLQLAVAYSAIENGGTIVRPHVGMEIDAPVVGTELQKIDPPAVRYLHIQPYVLDAVRAGLRAAASQPGGTSFDVFSGFPQQVYGKTGTAERGTQANQSWYVCFVPSWATTKPILVVVTVEQGGFGAQAAAPAAREILSQWFYGNRGKFIAGASKTL